LDDPEEFRDFICKRMRRLPERRAFGRLKIRIKI
jgi:hypothetical protein